ncbi:conserved hypothetical protein [Weissella viridescens]|uniref:Uncharacterized protein n=2 Tax=Weissella viridescens TaxID=1629 RepID=A0A0R2H0P0_WEIVI|nr:hypothetical protein [Weissella viridescens]KRN46498.1 hypothetical protein IV50_GL000774 [Weissella viridescens]MBX4172971.1 hypothetical protein [Weissella viridescens]SOB42839.1 conserved hypothetical protein [Weissella viridescens]SUP52687.1 Uncharacterised protein [Weissella viridescens]GEA94875.1 hypothetical protein WVI01_07980 [Weissella viridescens]
MKLVDSKPWSIAWILEHIASAILLVGTVLAAASALTALIIGIEELLAIIFTHHFINTYTNVYNNALQTVFWHFVIIFVVVAFWSLLDTFTAEPRDTQI